MSPVTPSSPEDPHFEILLEFMKENRGFDFTGYKRASLARRVRRRMSAIGVESYEEYLDRLLVEPDEFTKLFDDNQAKFIELLGSVVASLDSVMASDRQCEGQRMTEDQCRLVDYWRSTIASFEHITSCLSMAKTVPLLQQAHGNEAWRTMFEAVRSIERLAKQSLSQLLAMGLFYALAMGLVGGLFPAIRAARLPIPAALREL